MGKSGSDILAEKMLYTLLRLIHDPSSDPRPWQSVAGSQQSGAALALFGACQAHGG